MAWRYDAHIVLTPLPFDALTTPVNVSNKPIAKSIRFTRHIKLTDNSADESYVLIGRSSHNAGKNLNPSRENALFDLPNVSRNHATIFLDSTENKVLKIRDCGSLHGTFRKGERVSKIGVELVNNDVITLGSWIDCGDEVVPAQRVSVFFKWVPAERAKDDEPVIPMIPVTTILPPAPDFELTDDSEDADVTVVGTETRKPILQVADIIGGDCSPNQASPNESSMPQLRATIVPSLEISPVATLASSPPLSELKTGSNLFRRFSYPFKLPTPPHSSPISSLSRRNGAVLTSTLRERVSTAALKRIPLLSLKRKRDSSDDNDHSNVNKQGDNQVNKFATACHDALSSAQETVGESADSNDRIVAAAMSLFAESQKATITSESGTAKPSMSFSAAEPVPKRFKLSEHTPPKLFIKTDLAKSGKAGNLSSESDRSLGSSPPTSSRNVGGYIAATTLGVVLGSVGTFAALLSSAAGSLE
ncbi:uncharacterized protein V1518DRAFT_410769 [Limtongia smithiae]|uniref:uncharacterized protein n=1 Tax=Limtongia smithiae TaxID=1125753 RepID=UPI0034CD0601